jgi:hypothetical protein
MPKATNLIEACNNFVVESLKTEEEFKDFYVERLKDAPSPIEELKDRIENAFMRVRLRGFVSLFHACSVKGICKSILFKHTKITVYLQKQMLFF